MLSILNAGHLPLKFYLKPNLFMILVSLREYLSRLIDHALILTLLLNLMLIYLNVARGNMLLSRVKICLSFDFKTLFFHTLIALKEAPKLLFFTLIVLNCI